MHLWRQKQGKKEKILAPEIYRYYNLASFYTLSYFALVISVSDNVLGDRMKSNADSSRDSFSKTRGSNCDSGRSALSPDVFMGRLPILRLFGSTNVQYCDMQVWIGDAMHNVGGGQQRGK